LPRRRSSIADRLREPAFHRAAALLWVDHVASVTGLYGLQNAHLAGDIVATIR
jgi:hypothetical protein